MEKHKDLFAAINLMALFTILMLLFYFSETQWIQIASAIGLGLLVFVPIIIEEYSNKDNEY